MLDKKAFIVYDINNISNAVTGSPHTKPRFRELPEGARQYRECRHWPLSSALNEGFFQ